MTVIDIVILAIVAWGVLSGLLRGALKQLAGLLGLVVGLLAAKALYAVVAVRIFSQVTDNLTVAQVLAFIAIWVIVPLLFWSVACVLTHALEAVSLGWMNRLLGGLLGGLVHLLLASLLVCVLEYVDGSNRLIDGADKRESIFYYEIKPLAGLFFPAAKDLAEQIYEEINDATNRI